MFNVDHYSIPSLRVFSLQFSGTFSYNLNWQTTSNLFALASTLAQYEQALTVSSPTLVSFMMCKVITGENSLDLCFLIYRDYEM